MRVRVRVCTDAFLFYKNKIAGTIPGEIGNMDKLTWIDMEDNQIVGTIPESFYSNLDLEKVIFKNNSSCCIACFVQ